MSVFSSKGLRELLYIKTLAQEKTISKAAEKLYIAQPSLSHFLKEFEARLGYTLFRRSSRGLVPTEAGKCIIDASVEILDRWDQALNHLYELGRNKRYTFAIPSFRGRFILAPFLAAAGQKYPNVEITVTEMLTCEMLPAFLEGKIQAGFIVGIKPQHEDIEIVLVVGPSDPILKKAHEHNGRRWIEPQDLNGQTMILLPPGHSLHTYCMELLKNNGITPKKIQYINNITTSFQMSTSGSGFSFMPAMFLEDCKGTPLSIGEKGVGWGIYLAFHRKAPSAINNIVLELVEEILEK